MSKEIARGNKGRIFLINENIIEKIIKVPNKWRKLFDAPLDPYYKEWREILAHQKINQLNCKHFPKISQFTDDGIASWYDVAVTVSEIAFKKGLIKF